MNRCWRTSASVLVALVLMLGALACGRTAKRGRRLGRRRREDPRAATENQINALPRDQVQDGGRLTWPIGSMPVTYNYLHIDGTEQRPLVLEACVDAADVSRGCGRRADLESGLPGVRADAGHRAEAGGHLQHQSEGDLVRRHADHLGRLPLAVAGAQRLQQGLPDLVVQRLLGHRERRARPRRPRGDRHLQEQVRRLAGDLLRPLSCLDQQVAEDLQRRMEGASADHGRPVQARAAST